MSNIYLEKIASMFDLLGSVGTVATKAVKGTSKYVADTAAGALGRHKIELINRHMYQGKGTTEQLTSALRKYKGLNPDNIDMVKKFHADIKYHAPKHLDLSHNLIRDAHKAELDDRVRSGIIGIGAVVAADKLKQRATNNQSYGEY